ncbi:hypothetical protein LZ30DRAFT_239008 [Colletotrichum cereale]|nr:hypothetical protein LZ30DRAFT_239008 [Colletotrichum cereale]
MSMGSGFSASAGTIVLFQGNLPLSTRLLTSSRISKSGFQFPGASASSKARHWWRVHSLRLFLPSPRLALIFSSQARNRRPTELRYCRPLRSRPAASSVVPSCETCGAGTKIAALESSFSPVQGFRASHVVGGLFFFHSPDDPCAINPLFKRCCVRFSSTYSNNIVPKTSLPKMSSSNRHHGILDC